MADEESLLPLRMVNEWVYCPRLFWLEHVGREFAESHDTLDGARVHRNVDRQKNGKLGAEDGDSFESRSVTLSSERLGIIGTLDIVEGAGNVAVPIDYKRGVVPKNVHRAYDPERVQLCLQGLLLREAGFTSDYGTLYYAASRTRVEVPFDTELIELALTAVRDAREASERPERIPPPLVDSPKCPRCSLVGLCLPDEINALRASSPQKIRPLVVAEDEALPLYILTPGASVGKDDEVLQIRRDGVAVDEVRLIDVSHVALFGNVQLSTQALRALLERDTPVFYFSFGVWLVGMSIPASGHSADARIAQHELVRDGSRSLDIARTFIEGKIRNQRTLVRRSLSSSGNDAKRDLGQLAFAIEQARRAGSRDELLGWEGRASRIYFSCFVRMLRPQVPFDFDGRNRRPPKDPINALLSFCYALLVKDCLAALLAVGLEPAVGILHQHRPGRPSLALDLAEEFRPLIADSVVLSAVNTGELEEKHFVRRGVGVTLTDEGRRAAVNAYERRMQSKVTHPVFGYAASYRRVLAIQARLLARTIQGDVPSYPPFVTR